MKALLIVTFVLLTIFTSQGQPCAERAIIDADTIVLSPEKPARTEEGLELYMGWISNHMDPKLRSHEAEVKKKVYVRFVVDEQGQLSDFEIMKGLGASYDREAIALIKKHPHKWIAAQCSTRKVRSWVILPITFNMH